MFGGLSCVFKANDNFRLFIDCAVDKSLISHLPNTNQTFTIEKLLAVLLTSGRVTMYLTYAVCYMNTYALVLNLWIVVNDFDLYCQTDIVTNSHTVFRKKDFMKSGKLQRVLNILIQINSTCDVINNVLHNKLALYLINASFYFPLNFSILLRGCAFSRVNFGLSFTFVCITMITAATVKTKISKSAKRWILQCSKVGYQLKDTELFMLRTLYNRISVRGSRKVRVTFALVGDVSNTIGF